MIDKPVRCRVIDHDHYRRAVAVCSASTVELNRRMVEDGWATAYERLPSIYSAAKTERAPRGAASAGLFRSATTVARPGQQ